MEARAERSMRLLAGTTDGIPRFLEIVSRHAVTPRDGFTMLPGFGNFETVRSGQLVATDRSGGIRVRRAARLFMPLYQDQGNDGFFLVRPVRSAGAAGDLGTT